MGVEWIFLIPAVICTAIQTLVCLKSKRPLLTAVKILLMGAATLVCLCFALRLIGVYAPVNLYSLITSAVLGIPGIVLMLLLNVFL